MNLSLIKPLATISKVLGIAVVIAAISYLLFFAKFDVVSQGEGVLAINDSNINVISPSSGIIRTIFVTAGDKVDLGTPLMTISNIEDQNKRDLFSSKTKVINEQINTLVLELDALKKTLNDEKPYISTELESSTKLLQVVNKYQTYVQKKEEFEDTKKTVRDRIKSFESQKALLEQKSQMILSTLGNTIRYIDSKLEVERIQLQIVESKIEIEQAKSIVDIAFNEFNQLVLLLIEESEDSLKTNREELASADAELNTVNERIQSTDINSTAKGTVLSVKVGLSKGIYIERNADIMTIKREDDGIFVDAKFDSKYRPYIDLNVPVKIKINAPGIKDYFTGKITNISVDSFERDNQSSQKDRYYEVKIIFDEDNKNISKEKLSSLLGIRTIAYVINDQMTFIEYILSTFNKDLDFTVW